MGKIVWRNYGYKLKRYSRENRKFPTFTEKIIRKEILKNKQTGYKFLRQKPIDRFILDFYSARLKLGIEIDGGYHNTKEQLKLDKEREKILNSFYDIVIIRYTNQEIIEDIEWVRENLLLECEEREKHIKEHHKK